MNDDSIRVKEATDIVDLIGSYIELRRAGRGFSGLCPWHADRKPSLQINQAKQIYRCFVCDVGGDVFSWVMAYEGLSFPEALQKLADRAGIQLSGKRGSSDPGVKSRLLDVMEWAVGMYRGALVGSDAYKYLRSRGISDESIEKFDLGFAPGDWQYLIGKCGRKAISVSDLELAGLAAKSDRGRFDRFRGRVIFPIRDLQGRCIALGGRLMPGAPGLAKYINSPETPLFSKLKNLYALDVARNAIRSQKQSIVMEGYTDVIIAHQCGIENAVACLGTSFGEYHVKQLRYQGDQIVLVLDGDKAGQDRAEAVLPMLVQQDAKVLTLPDGQDPADFILKSGAVKFREMVEDSPDPVDFKVRRSFSGFDPRVDLAKARTAIDSIVELVAKASDIVRSQAEARICEIAGVRQHDVRMAIGDRKHADRQKKKVEIKERSVEKVNLPRVEWELIILAVSSPDVVPLMLERLDHNWLESQTARKIMSLYEHLELTGQDFEFGTVMGSVEDETLRSVLASAASVDDVSIVPADVRMSSAIEMLSKRHRFANFSLSDI